MAAIPSAASNTSTSSIDIRAVAKIIAINVALLAFGLGAVLLPAEFMLRARIPIQPPMTEFDATTGYRLRPYLDVPAFSPGDFEVRYRTNSRGLRGTREFTSPNFKKRVIGIGDSFTFGIGVEDSETFLAQLQERIDPDIDIINAGVFGWGTAQQLAYYENKGRTYDAEVVLIAMYENDLNDNAYMKLYELRGEDLHYRTPKQNKLRKITSYIPMYDLLATNSALLSMLRTQLTKTTERSKVEDLASDAEDSVRGAYITKMILRQFLRIIKGLGKTPVLMILPSRDSVSKAKTEEFKALEAICETHREICKNTYPILTTSGLRPAELYFQNYDRHLTAAGHRVIAQYLTPIIKELF